MSRVPTKMPQQEGFQDSIVLNYFDTLERGLCLRVNALSRWRLIRKFFTVISKLGDYSIWFVLGFVCLLQPQIEASVLVPHALLMAGIGILVYKLLKKRLVRERPFIRHGEIVCAAAPLDRYSFPSGHTLHAVAFTILYGTYVPVMLWLLVPLALLIAASRVILGLHYPSDVLVGGTIGATLAISSINIVNALVL